MRCLEIAILGYFWIIYDNLLYFRIFWENFEMFRDASRSLREVPETSGLTMWLT